MDKSSLPALPARLHGRAFLLAIAAVLGLGLGRPHAQPTQASKEDSGWVPLFNGTSLGEDTYVYSGGYVDVAAQTTFKAENGTIHAVGPYALLITKKEYGFYKVRVDYRFAASVGGNGNAGMMILMDNEAAKTLTKTLRPRSIEINCRRDNNYPWTLWASQGLGPIMTTTVKKGTAQFQTKADGGVAYTVDPTGDRTLESSYANPELPPGQWNHGEAYVFGDSGVFYLNGKLRTAGWQWSVKLAGKTTRVAQGGIGVQSEGFDVTYRDWEVQELDSATHLPLNARKGCTDQSSPKYDPRAVIADGSCGTSVSLAGAFPGPGNAPSGHGILRDIAGRKQPVGSGSRPLRGRATSPVFLTPP